MLRAHDLSELIVDRRSSAYLSEALGLVLDWARFDRLEANYTIPQTDRRLLELVVDATAEVGVWSE